MEKLSEIGDDIQLTAGATYQFWKHVMQLMIHIGSLGKISFETERASVPEEKLQDIEGKYFKLKFKNPQPNLGPGSTEYITPIEDTLIVHEVDQTDALFIEDGKVMQEQLEKLSDAWYVFAALGLAFALAAYWIYR